MLKKLNNNERLWIAFGILCLLLFININIQAREQKQEQEVVTEEPICLQIHYGNGEVYEVEAKSVAVGMNHAPIATLENLQRKLSVLKFRIDNYSVSTETARPKERLNERLIFQQSTVAKDVEFSL